MDQFVAFGEWLYRSVIALNSNVNLPAENIN